MHRCWVLFIAAVVTAAGLRAPAADAVFAPHFPPSPDPIVGLQNSRAYEPSPAAKAAPTQPYSHGDPSAEEQLILEFINRARSDPTAEGKRLAATTDPDIRQAYQFFGISTAQIESPFAQYPTRPPLAFHPSLLASARAHAQDMAANNFQGHDSTSGANLVDRVEGAGYQNWNNLGENVYAYMLGLFYGHAGLNVDWGVPDLGHRQNIMNFSSATFREIGIGIARVSNATGTNVGPILMTQDFGSRFNNQIYLIGVVYRDKDKNGFYTVGEGLAGVPVVPETGNFFAVTSSSGGYAIPLTSAVGSLVVTISAGSANPRITKSVALTGNNVKLDFETISDRSITNAPPSIAITSPDPNSRFAAPATIILSANASDSDGTVAKVEFLVGTVRLAELTAPPFSFSWNNVMDGSYLLTAKATDNSGAASTSASVNITVATETSTNSVATAISRFSPGNRRVDFRFSGSGGRRLLIQASTDFASWDTINTVDLTQPTFDVGFAELDPSVFPQRYFRAILEP